MYGAIGLDARSEDKTLEKVVDHEEYGLRGRAVLCAIRAEALTGPPRLAMCGSRGADLRHAS